MRIFLTGEVAPIDSEDASNGAALWGVLSREARRAEKTTLDGAIANRRASMLDNASKGGLLFGALGFAVAVATALAVIQPNQAILLLGLVAILAILTVAKIVILMISPKAKVMRRKHDRIPTGLKLLQRAASEQKPLEAGQQHPVAVEGWAAQLEGINILEKREFLTLVERRALRIACLLFVGALVLIDAAIIVAIVQTIA